MDILKENCLKHDRHKENIISHTNFAKLKVRCIQSFLMTGLWRRKTHGSRATGCFWRGHGAKKERTERATERQERAKVTKVALMKAVWGSYELLCCFIFNLASVSYDASGGLIWPDERVIGSDCIVCHANILNENWTVFLQLTKKHVVSSAKYANFIKPAYLIKVMKFF